MSIVVDYNDEPEDIALFEIEENDDAIIATIDTDGIEYHKPKNNITVVKKQPPKPAEPKTYIECLEKLIREKVPFTRGYESQCSGRCPNGLIAEYILHDDSGELDHGDIIYRLEKIGIRTPETNRDVICLMRDGDYKCGYRLGNDQSWWAYHFADRHKYSLEQIVAELKKL